MTAPTDPLPLNVGLTEVYEHLDELYDRTVSLEELEVVVDGLTGDVATINDFAVSPLLAAGASGLLVFGTVVQENATAVPILGIGIINKPSSGAERWVANVNKNIETLLLRRVHQFATVALMKASTDLVIGAVAITQGYWSAGDGGGAKYRVVPAGTGTLDNGAYHALGMGGQAELVVAEDGFVNYEMWGARRLTSLSDNTDSLAAINAAHNFIARALSVPANWKAPIGIKITGLFGVSDTVVFSQMHGMTFEGSRIFAYQSPGFKWVSAVDNTKSLFKLAGCRYSTWKNIRGIAPYASTEDGVLNAMFDLDGTTDFGVGIQERCYFEKIMCGTRDGYEAGVVSEDDYIFKYMFKTSGENANNDFHVFDGLQCYGVGYGLSNQATQAVQWLVRSSSFKGCDGVAKFKGMVFYFDHCEANNCKKALFVCDGDPEIHLMNIIIDRMTTEGNLAEFLTSVCAGNILVRDTRIWCNEDDVTYPYTYILSNAGQVSLVHENVTMVESVIGGTTTAVAAIGATYGPRTISLWNSTELHLDYTGGGPSQRIYYEQYSNAQRYLPSGINDERYKPFSNLLNKDFESAFDKERYDLPQRKNRFGNRFRGGATTIQHENYDSGTIPSGATYTFTGAIPANRLLLGVTAHNQVAITGATGYSIGISGVAAKYGTKAAAADDTVPASNLISGYTITTPEYTGAAALDIILTATGSNFTGGRVWLTVHYITLEPKFYNPSGAA